MAQNNIRTHFVLCKFFEFWVERVHENCANPWDVAQKKMKSARKNDTTPHCANTLVCDRPNATNRLDGSWTNQVGVLNLFLVRGV